jgi:GDP-4-dehydro-6-deoxy-D-mannose reductase
MRVLITGALGFAGRHLAAHCAMQDCSAIVGIGRRGPSEADLPSQLTGYESVDLADAAATEDAIRSAAPDSIFHLAAASSVASSWREPASVIANNVCSTLNLLDAVRRFLPQTRVLVACSGEEYGEPEHLPVTEDHRLRPKNPYAVSKASSDLAAGFYAEAYGLQIVRTRAFNHAGPGQSDTYVISSFARQIAEAEAAGAGGEGQDGAIEVVTGNPDVRRDFTDVRDVVRAYWLALHHASPDVYNVCSGRSSVIRDILAGLSRHTSLDVRRRTDEKLLRENEVMEIRGSHERLTAATGWRPEIPLERTLADALDWWRERARAGVAG